MESIQNVRRYAQEKQFPGISKWIYKKENAMNELTSEIE